MKLRNILIAVLMMVASMLSSSNYVHAEEITDFKVMVMKVVTEERYNQYSRSLEPIAGIKYQGSDGEVYTSDTEGIIELKDVPEEGLTLAYIDSSDGITYFHQKEVKVKKEDFFNGYTTIEKYIYIAEETLIQIGAEGPEGERIRGFTAEAKEDGQSIPVKPSYPYGFKIKARPGKTYEIFGANVDLYDVTPVYEFTLNEEVEAVAQDNGIDVAKFYLDTLDLKYKMAEGSSTVTLNVLDASTKKPLKGEFIEYQLALKDAPNDFVLKGTMDENGQIVFKDVPKNFKGQTFVLNPTYETENNYFLSNNFEFKVEKDNSQLEFSVYVSKEKQVKVRLRENDMYNRSKDIKKANVLITVVDSISGESNTLSTDENGEAYFTAKTGVRYSIYGDRIEGYQLPFNLDYQEFRGYGSSEVAIYYRKNDSDLPIPPDQDEPTVPETEGVQKFDRLEIILKGSDEKGLTGEFKLYAPAKYYTIYPYEELMIVNGEKYIQIRPEWKPGGYSDRFKTADGRVSITAISTYSMEDELRAININEFVILQEKTEDGYAIERQPIFSNENGNFVVENKRIDERKVLSIKILDGFTGDIIDDANISGLYRDQQHQNYPDDDSDIVNNQVEINENQRKHFLHKIKSDNYWSTFDSKEITDEEIEKGEALIKLYPKTHGRVVIAPSILVKDNNRIVANPYEGIVEVLDSTGNVVDTLEFKNGEAGPGGPYPEGMIIDENAITKWLPLGHYFIQLVDSNGETHRQELRVDEEHLDEYGQMLKHFRVSPLLKLKLSKIDKFVRAKLKGAEFSIYRAPTGVREEEKATPAFRSIINTPIEKEPVRDYDELGYYYNYNNQVWKFYQKISIDENGNIKIIGDDTSRSAFLELALFEDALGGYFGNELLSTEYKYLLVETTPPEGYILDSTPIEIGKMTDKSIKVEVIPENQSVRAKRIYAFDDLIKENTFIKLYRQIEDGILEEVPNAPTLKFESTKTYVEWQGIELMDTDGNPYQFVAKNVGENEVEYTGDSIIISNEPSVRNIKITKQWFDEYGKEIEKRDNLSTKVDLKANDDTVKTLELSDKNNWEVLVSNLPVLADNGVPIDYSVKEVGEKDGKISLGGEDYRVEIVGNPVEGFTITNSKTIPLTPMTPPTRTLKVSKIWSGIDGKAIDGPVDAITVELFKDGQTTGATLELTAANGWTSQFTNLPVSATLGGAEHEYTIKEVGEEEGSIQVNGTWYGVNYGGTMTDVLTVTNKAKVPLTPLIPPTRTLKVSKIWSGID
ncbi:hypothetical protein J2S23_001660, partial [Streptococcus moroccensis]